MTQPNDEGFESLGALWRATTPGLPSEGTPTGETLRVIAWTQSVYAQLPTPALRRPSLARHRNRRRLRVAAAAAILLVVSGLALMTNWATPPASLPERVDPEVAISANSLPEVPAISRPRASVVRAERDRLELAQPGLRLVLVTAESNAE